MNKEDALTNGPLAGTYRDTKTKRFRSMTSNYDGLKSEEMWNINRKREIRMSPCSTQKVNMHLS